VPVLDTNEIVLNGFCLDASGLDCVSDPFGEGLIGDGVGDKAVQHGEAFVGVPGCLVCASRRVGNSVEK